MRFALLILSFFVSAPVLAGTLSNLDIYKRCYVRMVRSIPPTTDPLYIAVSKGQKAGPDACIELFDRAMLGTDGVLKNKNNAEARKILKTFNDLHRSWFQSKTIAAGSSLINDIEEPALYYTRAAFQTGTEFKTIVTGTTGLRGVRVQAQQDYSKFLSQRTIASYNAAFPYAGQTDLIFAFNKRSRSTNTYVRTSIEPSRVPAALMVDLGHLIGVAPSKPLTFNGFYGEYSASGAERLAAADATFSTAFVANAHMGGGILGSQTFLMANMNLGAAQFPNDVSLINRRLTSRVFEDLLCHQMPSLTDADVKAETDALVAQKTPHTFQQTTSCMRCHSSIDGMGFGFRNLITFPSSSGPQLTTQEVGLQYIGVMKLPTVPNANLFALKNPAGTLHYRENITKSLRKANFSSLQQMGNTLAAYNDIYYCAAKRYYHFLTGINVDITQAPQNKLDKTHYDKVKALGAKLQSKQKVRDLLFDIFSSDAFKSWNYLSSEEQQ